MTRKRKVLLLVIAIVVLVASAAVVLFWRANSSLEEPAYQVVETSEVYEIRQYDSYLVAETETSGDFKSAGNQAFRILAGYIFGKNKSGTKMSMTAPVESTDAKGVSMNMTAPVVSVPAESDSSRDDSGEKFRYRFVMESKYSRETLPVPLDPRISIKTIDARLVAARRYSGSWGQAEYKQQKAELLEALARDGRTTQGAAQFARYNAPFTPSFLRRNEVLIELADAP